MRKAVLIGRLKEANCGVAWLELHIRKVSVKAVAQKD